MREKLFKCMTDPWQKACDAGVFTEFMEQRAPGHAIMDDKIYRFGMNDFKRQISESRAKLDFDNDPDAAKKDQQLEAMGISADAVMIFAKRYSLKAAELAAAETDAAQASAAVNRRAVVIAHA